MDHVRPYDDALVLSFAGDYKWIRRSDSERAAERAIDLSCIRW